ncbi:MAG: single-stranded DNA-binding protein [Hyphomicrobium zavarzinii]|jgi:single-strand DNA-binding protein|uniref:single-stranded DNA-binding protein n=1 Tax=Hyphomicrobium zavarzinii TaxID=48292 RepID=UPI001A543299|nr:single-stranded DNA-binding protein [Hyphomicrobium zavarzinii]MBL8845462.1 single-stranded DNA-binding protein [Hyphomicrobium zavarzinii]
MNGNIEAAFIGRVGSDPELKTSAEGKPWAAFNVAVGKDEATQWVRVAVFGARAEELAGPLKKGDRVYVEGNLTMRTWEKSGEKRAGINVAAWKCECLGQIGRNKPSKAKALPEGDHSAPMVTQQPRHAAFEDEIPF